LQQMKRIRGQIFRNGGDYKTVACCLMLSL